MISAWPRSFDISGNSYLPKGNKKATRDFTEGFEVSVEVSGL